MALEEVYRYGVYDIMIDDYRYSTRYATMRQINRVRGRAIYPGIKIDSKYLKDGWTK
jgi:hypothetical protein